MNNCRRRLARVAASLRARVSGGRTLIARSAAVPPPKHAAEKQREENQPNDYQPNRHPKNSPHDDEEKRNPHYADDDSNNRSFHKFKNQKLNYSFQLSAVGFQQLP
jgi:hypothetical protein